MTKVSKLVVCRYSTTTFALFTTKRMYAGPEPRLTTLTGDKTLTFYRSTFLRRTETKELFGTVVGDMTNARLY